MRSTALLCALLIATIPTQSQTARPSLPDPVKFVNKLDIVWNVVRYVITEPNQMGLSIELDDKKGGRIITKPYEFITGSLTATELEKVAIPTIKNSGTWIKAQYAVEAQLEIVSATETLVTVRTKILALNRELNGTEKWIPWDSLGTYEKRVLGKISLRLLGSEMQFETKKGFWDKSPQPVNPRKPKL